MAKAKTQYQCRACGAPQPKWAGQCPDCGEWNTLEASAAVTAPTRFANYPGHGPIAPQPMAAIPMTEQTRTPTQEAELNRVLGGGIVAGSVVLIGGDPGIGKSTLLLQMVSHLELASLYVSGEESAQQIKLRAGRLGLGESNLHLLIETGVETIVAITQQHRPQVLVIDSIQTLFSDKLASAPGSVTQVRESAAQLVRFAKQTGTTIFLVGHVTKEGSLAGPRVLEHMVDTVLYFEGDPSGRYRVLRAIKNRFGAVNELGIFVMAEEGLKGVANPSAIFLSRHETPVPGSVILVAWEGTRPLLVEVQALVAQSHLANPRRVAVGLDGNRIAMLLAVLHRHGGVAMYDQDVFINVVGGMRIVETAADLALVLAALSSLRNTPLPSDLVVFGELGLAGEIRPVPNGQERLREAVKHGFKRAIIPRANAPRTESYGLEVIAADRLQMAMTSL